MLPPEPFTKYFILPDRGFVDKFITKYPIYLLKKRYNDFENSFLLLGWKMYILYSIYTN